MKIDDPKEIKSKRDGMLERKRERKGREREKRGRATRNDKEGKKKERE